MMNPNYTLETYIILLTKVTLIHLIRKKDLGKKRAFYPNAVNGLFQLGK